MQHVAPFLDIGARVEVLINLDGIAGLGRHRYIEEDITNPLFRLNLWPFSA
jgi:hypothetical protein